MSSRRCLVIGLCALACDRSAPAADPKPTPPAAAPSTIATPAPTTPTTPAIPATPRPAPPDALAEPHTDDPACKFVDRRITAGETFTDWPALHAALQVLDRDIPLRDGGRECASPPCPDVPAAPCFGTCDGAAPWLVTRGGLAGARAVVTPLSDGRLHAIVLRDPFGLSCEDISATSESCTRTEDWARRGPVWHYTATQRAQTRESSRDCDDDDADCENVQWNDLANHLDLFFTGDPLRLVATVARDSEGDAAPAVTLALTDTRLEIRGKGCTLDLPLP